MLAKNKNIILIAILSIIVFLTYLFYQHKIFNRKYLWKSINILSSEKSGYQYISECNCRKNDVVYVHKIKDSYQVTTTLKNLIYMAEKEELDELTCGTYETLRRGLNQKVIGYSLYGKNEFYYVKLKGNK